MPRRWAHWLYVALANRWRALTIVAFIVSSWSVPPATSGRQCDELVLTLAHEAHVAGPYRMIDVLVAITLFVIAALGDTARSATAVARE